MKVSGSRQATGAEDLVSLSYPDRSGRNGHHRDGLTAGREELDLIAFSDVTVGCVVLDDHTDIADAQAFGWQIFCQHDALKEFERQR